VQRRSGLIPFEPSFQSFAALHALKRSRARGIVVAAGEGQGSSTGGGYCPDLKRETKQAGDQEPS